MTAPTPPSARPSRKRANPPIRPPWCALVGAGPGDPGLLTLKALRTLRRATVLLVDDLVSDAVVALALRGRRRPPRVVHVGKRGGCQSTPQAFIERLMVSEALAGERVVRVKGGDPFVFGRGGEELQALAAQGLPFEVVPGITAACGVAAYAGIPLTHRDFAQSCLFVTGHLRDNSFDLDWTALTRPRQTVVIYMGLTGLATICSRLVEHGLSTDWPAAVVAQGTLASQRVVIATLATLAAAVERAGLCSPCLTIVGEVVRLRDDLAWFDRPSAIPATAAAPHSLTA